MLTFAQFIAEARDINGNEYWSAFDDGRNVKGWMSPSGKAHDFLHTKEHYDNHHPEYLKQGGKQGDSVHLAQKKGFVRYGQSFGNSMHGSHYWVHFDAKHPQGHRTALKALEHLKPEHHAPVAISGNAGVYKTNKAGKMVKNRTAMKHLETVMSTREAHQALRAGAEKERARESK